MENTNRPLIIGHRGAKGLALENTAASVEAAISYGVDQVEIDLRVCKDGTVVLLHDAKPVARNGERIHTLDYNLAELREWFPDLLTLQELLTVVNHRCRIMLEFKELAAVTPTLEILRKSLKQGWKEEEFLFASFQYEPLRQLRAAYPNIDVVVLDNWSSIRAVRRAKKLGTTYLSMDQRYLWWGVIWSLSKQHKLFCYPNHKLIHIKHAKPRKWVKYGLYGIITDYPNFFLAKRPSGIVEGHESDI